MKHLKKKWDIGIKPIKSEPIKLRAGISFQIVDL